MSVGSLSRFEHVTDFQALSRAVLEKPFDAAPRLVLADFIQENGGERVAKFIRRHIKSPFKNEVAFDQWRVGDRFVWRMRRGGPFGYASEARTLCPPELMWSGQCHAAGVDRGFTGMVTLNDQGRFSEAAPWLFSHFPITRVRMSNLSAYGRQTHCGNYSWFRKSAYSCRINRDVIRDEVFDLLKPKQSAFGDDERNYETRAGADEDLSRALVKYGRSKADGTYRIPCPHCSGEGCATHGHGDTSERCWGEGYLEKPGLPPLEWPNE
jgi:uncharacterized protein (TIGR02996 family)